MDEKQFKHLSPKHQEQWVSGVLDRWSKSPKHMKEDLQNPTLDFLGWDTMYNRDVPLWSRLFFPRCTPLYSLEKPQGRELFSAWMNARPLKDANISYPGLKEIFTSKGNISFADVFSKTLEDYHKIFDPKGAEWTQDQVQLFGRLKEFSEHTDALHGHGHNQGMLAAGLAPSVVQEAVPEDIRAWFLSQSNTRFFVLQMHQVSFKHSATLADALLSPWLWKLHSKTEDVFWEVLEHRHKAAPHEALVGVVGQKFVDHMMKSNAFDQSTRAKIENILLRHASNKWPWDETTARSRKM